VLQTVYLLIFLVNEVSVVFLCKFEQFIAWLKLLLLVFYGRVAEVYKNLVYILDCENHSRTRSERLHFSASIAHLSNQTLNGYHFVRYVEMHIRVDLIEKCCGKLLERMNMILNLWNLYSKAFRQGCTLGVERLDWSIYDELFDFIAVYLNLCFSAKVIIKCNFLFQACKFFPQNFY